MSQNPKNRAKKLHFAYPKYARKRRTSYVYCRENSKKVVCNLSATIEGRPFRHNLHVSQAFCQNGHKNIFFPAGESESSFSTNFHCFPILADLQNSHPGSKHSCLAFEHKLLVVFWVKSGSFVESVCRQKWILFLLLLSFYKQNFRTKHLALSFSFIFRSKKMKKFLRFCSHEEIVFSL